MPVNSRKHRLEPESRGCGAESAMSEKKSSIRDVAQLAGVSISTVSRVLNDPERAKSIPPEMRERVRQAVEALRYVPNFNARRVFMHRAEEIGLLIPSSRNLGMPIFEDRHLAKLVSGIEAGLEESNYRLLLIFNDERFVERREYLSLIQSQHVDGLIVWGAQATGVYWREPVAAGLPLVFACTIPGEADAFNHVVNATRQGVEQVLSLLYRNGHRHIVFMPERKLVNWREWKKERFLSLEMQQAVREFRAAHRDLNLEMSPFYFDVAEKLQPELFGRPDSPSAVATYNYNMAEEVYRHLTAIGVRVPEEVELFSCYGFVSSRNWISSIEVDDFEMGRRAAGSLLELIETPKLRVRLEIPGTLRLNRTTRPLPGNAP